MIEARSSETGLLRCATCKLLFDLSVEGTADEVNECGGCGKKRMDEARDEYEMGLDPSDRYGAFRND